MNIAQKAQHLAIFQTLLYHRKNKPFRSFNKIFGKKHNLRHESGYFVKRMKYGTNKAINT
ncbi:MAG: hypothetical protein ACXWFF_17265 [Methylomonas sp.]